MKVDCSFNGQTYTCLTPNWPEQQCENGEPSKRKNGQCMFLREDNRCDNPKNMDSGD